jgi:D-3-phosphoglycerate dehydrogenase
MSEYRVLISCPLLQESIDGYVGEFESRGIAYDDPEVDQQLNEDELLKIIHRYDGVIAGDDEFTAAVFDAAERLKIVVKWGIGTDNIDFEAAERNGIGVVNTPGAFAAEVADVAIGYGIMLTRRLHVIDREVRQGSWYCPRGVSLAGRTFGVVGVGSIGSETARRARAHDMNVLGYDIEQIEEDLKEETGIESVGLNELFERSDIVSLHCPLIPQTEEMVDSEKLEALGPGGYLINTARGGLIDRDALVNVLQEKAIAGVALDVFEQEPLPESNALSPFENVILGSHNAQNTTEAVRSVSDRSVELLFDNLE